jgi:hypothetical protein
MYAELFAKSNGYNRGKGGSMHIAALDLGMIGANGIVAAGAPIALGVAFASAYEENERVTVCFFGDGATNEGAFHEAVNMAAILKAPVVFVCENNLYGEWTQASMQTSVRDIADRSASYGIPGVIVDGMDIMAVHEAATEAIARARRGEGPALDPEIAAWTAEYEGEKLEALLQAHGVPAHRTLDTLDLYACPQMQHREHYIDVACDIYQSTTVESSRLRLSESRPRRPEKAVSLGRDNRYVLETILGYSPERIAGLAEAGILL